MNTAAGKRKKLFLGLAMLGVFAAVLVLVFLPLFNGKDRGRQNFLNYLDSLYNSISKGSAYYMPALRGRGRPFAGKEFKVAMEMADPGEAQRAALLFRAAGVRAYVQGEAVKASGDLGAVMVSCLKDSEAMFHNQAGLLVERYPGRGAKTMLYAWWITLQALEKSLKRQKAFAQAKYIQAVKEKAVEMSYNYYGIEPQSIGAKWRMVAFSLLFYVVYTLWYGYGVMYFFEGWGYQLEDH